MSNPAGVDGEAQRLVRTGRLTEALPLAERAVAGAAVCLAGHAFLASVLLQLGRAEEADAVVIHANALPSGAADAYDGLAYVSLSLDRHERANALYRRAAELAPRVPRYWYNLAGSERSLGRLEAAESACDTAIALDSAQHPSYLLRSELRVQTPQANHIDELRSRLTRPGLDAGARAFLGYALAKELDDVGRVDEAFAEFAGAARARRSQITYDVAQDERRLKRIAAVFDGADRARDADAVAGGAGHGSRDLFVFGLPRSGTTLMERILGGLEGVRSNGETDNVSIALAAAARPAAAGMGTSAGLGPRSGSAQAPGDPIVRAAAAPASAVAAHYARLARAGRSGRPAGVDYVIEKLPTNYLYLGAIHRALPGASLLWVTRTPLDACFAMYRTLFGGAYPFTYDVEELARYYAAYARLMAHWRAVLGTALHEVVYEDLVREPAVVGAAVAARCGLTWKPEALDIARNPSVSLTASAAQVRRPVYGTSSGRWRAYRRHLGPLIAALRRQGVELPEDA